MVPKRFKNFFLWFLVFSNFFEIFRFFSQNDVFRLFAHDYPFLIEKSFNSQWNINFFVPILLKFSPKSIWVHQVPPTHKMSQNWRKIVQNGLVRDSSFSRLRPKSKKSLAQNFRPFSQISRFQTAFRFDFISLLIDFNFIDAVLT